MGAVGMLIVIVATLFNQHILEAGTQGLLVLFAGLLVGSALGALLALKVQMTDGKKAVLDLISAVKAA